VYVTLAVEGDIDLPIARRLLLSIGLELGAVYGLHGKDRLSQRLSGYNYAARRTPWFVLRDLNNDAPCAPELVRNLLPAPAPQMCFRVAVRSAEAWLLADREEIARFLGVSRALVPTDPETLPYPKQTLIDLARRSQRRVVKEDLVPAEGTSARVGPGYTGRMREFAADLWRPETAAHLSPSLQGCLRALRRWAADVKAVR
jgi:hypothetical protein